MKSRIAIIDNQAEGVLLANKLASEGHEVTVWCESEYDAPKVTSIKFVTDPEKIEDNTRVIVEIGYEEEKSGIKSSTSSPLITF